MIKITVPFVLVEGESTLRIEYPMALETLPAIEINSVEPDIGPYTIELYDNSFVLRFINLEFLGLGKIIKGEIKYSLY